MAGQKIWDCLAEVGTFVCRLKEDYLRLGGLPTGEDKQLGMMEKAVPLRCIAILGKHFE
jgi:hypothetical protein